MKALIFRPTISACDVLSMVEQITFQTISIVIAAATVVIGVINSIISNRREEKQRQEQLILQRSQGLSHEYFKAFTEVRGTLDWENVEDWNKKYSFKENPEYVSKWLYVLYTYNTAGISLKRGADPDLIFQLYSANSTLGLWELYEPVIKHIRGSNNNSQWMESFEYLYNEARKRLPQFRRSLFDLDTPRFKNE